MSDMKARKHYPQRDEFRATHDRCVVCWSRDDLELHHLVGRGSDKFETEWNYSMLCARCHRHVHSGGEHDITGDKLPNLTRGMIISAIIDQYFGGTIHSPQKCASAVHDWYELLAKLRGWKSLCDEYEPLLLPVAFHEERRLNR